MGACSFTTSAYGKSIQDAYNNAVEDATHEYGNDSYNGTISTTRGVRDVTVEYKRSGKSLNQYINDTIDNFSKWGACGGICIEEPKTNTNKIKTSVDHIISKGTKKWVLKYVVFENYNDRMIGSYKTKGEAVAMARKHCEQNQRTCTIEMVKELEKGSRQVARVTYKQATNEKKGKYVFFGWAAE